MKRMPRGRRVPRLYSSAVTSAGRRARRAATLVATAAVCAAVLPAAEAGAAPASPAGHPGLNAILAKASALSQQIDKLSEQYDGLKIQLAQARSEAAIAKEDAKRDEQLLGQDQGSIGAIAVENYMTGGINPALELLQTSSPQSLLDRASMMTQIEHENGAKVSLVAAAEAAAQRAVAAAAQQQQRAKSLEAVMAAKVAVIQKTENFFNSKAYQEAEAIFQQTGKYPISASQIPGDSIGVQALKAALTRVGYPYVWGAAGPTAFDCSGLVVWAYAQVGISLMHYTGDLWNEGEHVSKSELAPGDLVFFFADLGHVGIYIGNGLMVDAPTFGQNVQVQPVFWNAYVGAVRILG